MAHSAKKAMANTHFNSGFFGDITIQNDTNRFEKNILMLKNAAVYAHCVTNATVHNLNELINVTRFAKHCQYHLKGVVTNAFDALNYTSCCVAIGEGELRH